MTKIQHMNRHMYSITRRVNIACFYYYEFISHECFQPFHCEKPFTYGINTPDHGEQFALILKKT